MLATRGQKISSHREDPANASSRVRVLLALIGTAAVAAVSLNLTGAGPLTPLATNKSAPCGGEKPTIIGTSGDDVLVGTDQRDIILGRGGDDTIRGLGGNDALCGRKGNDTIIGGDGDDMIKGGAGNDEAEGQGGDDFVRGRSGNDDMAGGTGFDRLLGGDGRDDADGGPGLDACVAEFEIACNEEPKAKADSYNVNEDTTLTVLAPGVLGDDVDPEGKQLRAEQVTDASHGGVTVKPNGKLIYVPDLNFSGTDTFTYRASDGEMDSDPKTVTITVAAVNDAPFDITLSDNDIDENAGVNATVGTLTTDDPDSSDTHTYSLVSGAGDGDNSAFTIDGSALEASASFNFEADDEYSVRIRTTDVDGLTFEESFTINIDDINEVPTDLALDSPSVNENVPAGALVGGLTTTDVDAGDTHTYSLVAGDGGADNGRFTIDGTDLRTAEVFDKETQGPFSVRIRTTDTGGLSYEEIVQITINNVNETPTDIALSNASVDENQAGGTNVGNLSTTDQDTGDTHTYSFASGTGSTDNDRFTIDNGVLKTDESFDKETQGPFSVRIRTTDAGGLTYDEVFSITINNVNETPTDIGLSNASVNENQPSGTNVGNLSSTDVDAGDTHTYSLVPGAGDGDNGKFTIDNGVLKTDESFDNETQGPFSVRIRTTDAGGLTYEEVFSIAVNNVNETPTDIGLSNASVSENQPSGTNVGNLSTTDVDAGDTHTYSLVAGTGSTDNDRFTVAGGVLKTDESFDKETQGPLSVRIRTTDAGGLSYEEVFSITINNVNETPTDIGLSNASVAENAPLNTTVGNLSTTDVDAGDTHTYSLVGGTGSTDNGRFDIVGGALKTDETFDKETQGPFSVRVRTTDAGGLSYEEVFSITINNVNETPTDIGLSNASVNENKPSGEAVGNLSTTDVDAGDTHTYSLVSGTGSTDNDRFTVAGGVLKTDESFNKETQGPFSVRVRTTDAGGLTYEEVFSIAVNNVNEAPTDIALSNASVNENEPSGTNVGSLTSTDVDSGDTHTYSLVSGTGSTDNDRFTIAAGVLKTDEAFDKETQSPLSVRIRTTDAGGLFYDEVFSITVTDVNEAPVVNAATFSVDENSANNTPVGTATFTDQDSGQTHTFSITGGNTGGAFQIDPSTGEIAVADTNDLDYETNASFSLVVEVTDDGTPNKTGSNTITVDLTNVNDAPAITAPASVKGTRGTDIPVTGVSIADQDSGGSDIQLTVTSANGTATIDTTVASGVEGSDVTGNGTNSVVITASRAAINATLAADGLTYKTGPGFWWSSDEVTLSVDDLGNTGSGGAKTDTKIVTIELNQVPDVTNETVTTEEDTAKTITLTGADADGDPLTFKITSLPTGGAKLFRGTGTAGPDEITTVPFTLPADKVTYLPPLNANGVALSTFDYKANDGQDDSNTGTITVDVTAVNDNPVVTTPGADLTYTENDPATAMHPTITASDVDHANANGATVQITGNYVNGQDVLTFADAFGVTGSWDAPTGTLTLSGATTFANYEDALQSVKYHNTSDNPSTLLRTITYTITDPAAGSGSDTHGVQVVAVNDPPTVTANGANLSYTENDPPTAIHGTMTATDPDHTNASSATVQITGNYQNGQDVLSFVNNFGITGAWDAATGKLTLSGVTTVANYQSALQTVKYHNTSENPSSLTRTVTYTVKDPANAEGSDTFAITVIPVNDAPIPDTESLNGTNSALSNTKLDNGASATGVQIDVATVDNVKQGDFDHEGDTLSLVAGADCTTGTGPFTCLTDGYDPDGAGGLGQIRGTATLNSDGTFHYVPPAGFVGTDSFDYRISDGQAQNPEATGTVNINVVGPTPWYVDDSAAAGGTGTSEAPLQTLAPLSTGGGSDVLDDAGDRIFVYAGTYTSGIVLESTQKLIGQPNSLDVTDTLGRTHNDLVAAGGTAPAISHAGNTVVTLGSGNELQDLALGNGTITLAGTSVGTATVRDTSINTTGKALDINGGTMDMVFSTVTSNGSPTEAIELDSAAGSFTANGGTLQNATNAVVDIDNAAQDFTFAGNISDGSGTVISITNTDGGTKDFNGTTTGSTGGAGPRINLVNNGPSIIRFDNDINLNTGTLPAFNATGGGTIHVTSDDNILTTSTGTPLIVTGTTIGAEDLIFESISSNGALNGIVLDNTGSTGNFVLTGNGTTDGSGGSIVNSTASDAPTDSCGNPGSAFAGASIYLRNTVAPEIRNMVVNGSSNFGLWGRSVSGGFTMANTDFTGTHGNNNGQDEDAVHLCELTGTANISNSSITGGFENGLRVTNSTGTLNLTSQTNTFATQPNNLADDAFLVRGTGNASVTTTVTGSTFTTAAGDLLNYSVTDTATGNLTVSGSTFTNNHTLISGGGGGITIGGGGGNPNFTYSVQNNSFRGAKGNAITVTTGAGAGTYNGNISNNTIGVAGQAGTASTEAHGIGINHLGTGFHTIAVRNNIIRNYRDMGIRFLINDGDSTMRATVESNDIAQPGPQAFAGISVEPGGLSTDDVTMCLDLGGAGAEANKVSTGDPANFNDINLVPNGNTTVGLPGYGGGPDDTAAVQTYLINRNSGDGVPTAFVATSFAGNSTYANTTNCL